MIAIDLRLKTSSIKIKLPKQFKSESQDPRKLNFNSSMILIISYVFVCEVRKHISVGSGRGS